MHITPSYCAAIAVPLRRFFYQTAFGAPVSRWRPLFLFAHITCETVRHSPDAFPARSRLISFGKYSKERTQTV